ncbi:DUF3149 domain-containing protein [Azohydromonas sediminis]|uniref:DUF3149 domain-containing protein n=1 Tax=Azohydromonas sediminis TaxID=2259674 RepID=UPI001B354720|nr:DUF3149 domain-containing protein [Azohydromonas sediminis]
MHALIDFFSTDYGLMSAGVIAFMLGMGVFYVRFFVSHIHDEEQRAQRPGAPR